MTTCECGCGREPSPGCRFIHGHNGRRKVQYLVDPESGCWNWQGCLIDGYGQAYVNRAGVPAHRLIYEQHKGLIPDGLQLDHLCRNPRCVNPDHLEPVTNAENQRRGEAAKLDWEKVDEIRTSSASAAVLALKFGVTKWAIYKVREGKSWVAA